MNTFNLTMILGALASIISIGATLLFGAYKKGKREAENKMLKERLEQIETANEVERRVEQTPEEELRERLKAR